MDLADIYNPNPIICWGTVCNVGHPRLEQGETGSGKSRSIDQNPPFHPLHHDRLCNYFCAFSPEQTLSIFFGLAQYRLLLVESRTVCQFNLYSPCWHSALHNLVGPRQLYTQDSSRLGGNHFRVGYRVLYVQDLSPALSAGLEFFIDSHLFSGDYLPLGSANGSDAYGYGFLLSSS